MASPKLLAMTAGCAPYQKFATKVHVSHRKSSGFKSKMPGHPAARPASALHVPQAGPATVVTIGEALYGAASHYTYCY
jgi:hypothetical protein